MLTVADINAYLRLAVAYTYIGNDFPTTGTDDIAYVRMSGGNAPSEWTTKSYPGFQIVIRAKLPATAETIANAIYTKLHGKAEFTVGTTRVIKCVANQSVPWYLGTDENKRTLYSLNFTLTTL